MPTRACTRCKTAVSTDQKECPKCGNWMPAPIVPSLPRKATYAYRRDRMYITIGLCVFCLAVFGMLIAWPRPAGPHTLALAEKMKSTSASSQESFTEAFPSFGSAFALKKNDRIYMDYRYYCDDGIVVVTFDEHYDALESIITLGRSGFVHFRKFDIDTDRGNSR